MNYIIHIHIQIQLIYYLLFYVDMKPETKSKWNRAVTWKMLEVRTRNKWCTVHTPTPDPTVSSTLWAMSPTLTDSAPSETICPRPLKSNKPAANSKKPKYPNPRNFSSRRSDACRSSVILRSANADDTRNATPCVSDFVHAGPQTRVFEITTRPEWECNGVAVLPVVPFSFTAKAESLGRCIVIVVISFLQNLLGASWWLADETTRKMCVLTHYPLLIYLIYTLTILPRI